MAVAAAGPKQFLQQCHCTVQCMQPSDSGLYILQLLRTVPCEQLRHMQAHACEMLRFCCAIVYMNVCLRAPMTISWYLLANLGDQCRLYRFAFNGCAFSNLLHTVNHEQGKTQKALQEGFMCNVLSVLRYTASSRDHVQVRNPLTGRKSDHLGVRQCRTGTKFSQVMRHNHAKLQSTATMPL